MDSNSPSRNERRNYYRILNVQPDAPLEIIRNNYRTLLQKLRLHPDLGGKDWNASVINEAYNILRHPEKRAAYDTNLLNQFGVRKLSQGHLENQLSKNSNLSIPEEKDSHGNQRNFYRLFSIQADSPASIIKTSYLTLAKQSRIPKELLNEAYRILSNVDKRALYDQLITRYSHPEAVNKLNTKPTATPHRSTNLSIYNDGDPASSNHKNKLINKSYYQPVITQYCAFCKTPHAQSPCKDTAPLCGECKSPLFPPAQALLDHQRRDIIRLVDNSHVRLYTYWPGTVSNGTVLDISPLGLQLKSTILLSKDQLVKIDGENFKAVGVVSYSNVNSNKTAQGSQTTGIQFLTINFKKNKGQFFSESA